MAETVEHPSEASSAAIAREPPVKNGSKRWRDGETAGRSVAEAKKHKAGAPLAKKAKVADSLVIFGLGSRGKEFESQRHNVGHRVLQTLAKQKGAVAWQPPALLVEEKAEQPLDLAVTDINSDTAVTSAPSAAAAAGSLKLPGEGRPCILLPPQGAINDSGKALKDALHAVGHPDAAFLAVVDDCSLPLGTVRIKQKGSSGGHNGLKSIEGVFGQDYHRLKVGIGGKPTREHVTGQFAEGDEALLAAACVKRAAEAADLWLTVGPEGVEKVMSKVNSPEFRTAVVDGRQIGRSRRLVWLV